MKGICHSAWGLLVRSAGLAFLTGSGGVAAEMLRGAGLKDEQRSVLGQQYEAGRQRVEALHAEQAGIENKLCPAIMNLVQQCVTQIAVLDRLLIPVISLMRTELELPLNQEFYAQIIEDGHRKQEEFLQEFIHDQTLEVEVDSAHGAE